MWIVKLDSTTFFRGFHKGKIVGCEYQCDAKRMTETEAREIVKTLRRTGTRAFCLEG